MRPCGKNSWCTTPLQSKNRSWLFWMLPLKWLGLGVNVIAIHSWFVTSYDLFRQIWIVVEHCQHLLSDVSLRCCFSSKFSHFWTIFAAARFMRKTSVNIALHEPDHVPTSSAIVIRRLSEIVFFTALMFSSGEQNEHRHWHLLGLPWTDYTTIELVCCL